MSSRKGYEVGFRAKVNNKNEVKVNLDVLNNKKLSGSAKLVYIAISSFKPNKKITHEKIKERTNLHLGTIMTAINTLKHEDLLTLERIKGTREYVYILKPIQEISVDK